jgi:hypothetical protein
MLEERQQRLIIFTTLFRIVPHEYTKLEMLDCGCFIETFNNEDKAARVSQKIWLRTFK